ncbi:PepSY domain-containing protein [Bacillus tianshenii]|nr:PepSY domain-containing protein [Bacillus tianshenii]
MMKRKILVPALAFTIVGAGFAGVSLTKSSAASTQAVVQPEQSEEQEAARLQKEAKLTVAESEAIALKEVPGTVVDTELEDEDGIVVYGVEIETKDGTAKDVKIDAVTGKVLKIDTNDEDEQEDGSVEEEDGEENDND